MNKRINKAKLVVCLVLLWIQFVPKGYTQSKRMLTSEDYRLWSTGLNANASNDGKWVFYKESHLEGKDILHIKNIANGMEHNYLSVSWEIFSPDSKWFAFMKGDSLNLRNLRSGEKQIYIGITNFIFASEGRYLITNKTDASGITLSLRDLKTIAIKTIRNVKQYIFNPSQTLLGIVTEEDGINSVKIIALKPGLHSTVLISDTKSNYSGLTWNKLGASLAFFEQIIEDKKPVIKKIYACKNVMDKPIIKVLDPHLSAEFPNGFYPIYSSLYLSDDGRQLFLNLLKPKADVIVVPAADKTKSDVQIWGPNDYLEASSARQKPVSDLQWYTWWIDSAKILPVNDIQHPEAILTGDQKYVLLYNKTDYLPEYQHGGSYKDVYIRNLTNGNQELLVKKQDFNNNNILVSPAGKYIAYYKEKNWWVYSILKRAHTCITEGLNFSFEDVEYDNSGVKPSYGIPGWFDDDSELFVYDQFDVWIMSPDGSKRRRITDGRKSNITHRFLVPDYRISTPGTNDGFFKAHSIGVEEDMTISTLNHNTFGQGFCSWNRKSGLNELVQKDMKLSAISKAGFQKPFVFTASDFDVSPRLMLRTASGKEQMIYQSNPQQKDFYWGKSELINYNIPGGKQLKGVLFYPANYDASKKYPMIVYVYEKMSHLLHKYVTPSLFESSGFNTTNFTTQGYFVLMPDITYEINDPGVSAARCVIAATESIITRGLVDKNNIGLVGHSFGGYETAFIITQTNMFKTAIAGAPITDLVDHSLSISQYGLNMKLFEDGQFRIQSPFYDTDYQHNSTIANAQQINTPILLWAGEKDPIINWTQSRKLHIALWRLGKISTLLLYPGDSHALYNEAHQKDLTLKMKNWFDYYLKDEKPAEWIHITE